MAPQRLVLEPILAAVTLAEAGALDAHLVAVAVLLLAAGFAAVAALVVAFGRCVGFRLP